MNESLKARATELVSLLKQGAQISRERNLNLDYAKVADDAADEIERLNAEAVAADIRIANDSAVIAGLTAERDALRVDLIRLTEAAAALVSNEDHAISAGIKRDYQDGSQTWECWQGLRAAMKGEQP